MCAVRLSGSVRSGGEAGVGWGCVSLWFFRLVGARVGGLLPVGLWWVSVLVRDGVGVSAGVCWVKAVDSGGRGWGSVGGSRVEPGAARSVRSVAVGRVPFGRSGCGQRARV